MLENLKVLRKERKLSQQKLAEELEISQQSINQYENQNVEPDIEMLSRIADYFETSIDYLVGRTGTRGQTEELKIFAVTDEEVRIIRQYRTLTEKAKKCIEMMLETLEEK